MQNHDEYKCEHPEMIKHISGIKSQEPPVYHHDWMTTYSNNRDY